MWVAAQRWIAVETMLFETLGAWARSGDAPTPARRVLGTWSNRHAWHADLWRDRAPVIAHHDFPGDDDLSWVDSTRALVEADLSNLVDPVLSGLREHVAAHAGPVDAVLDGPTARLLALVASDIDLEISELRAVLP